MIPPPPCFYPLNPPCYYSYNGSGYLAELRACNVTRLRAAGVRSSAVAGYDALFGMAHTGMVTKQLPEHERAAVCGHLTKLADMMIVQQRQVATQPVQPVATQPVQPVPMYRVAPVTM